MIFTLDFITRENHWQIASLVTQKSLFTVTHALFFISSTQVWWLLLIDCTLDFETKIILTHWGRLTHICNSALYNCPLGYRPFILFVFHFHYKWLCRMTMMKRNHVFSQWVCIPQESLTIACDFWNTNSLRWTPFHTGVPLMDSLYPYRGPLCATYRCMRGGKYKY